MNTIVHFAPQKLRALIVIAAYRSPEHNRAVGEAKASKHHDGTVFDIVMTNHDPAAFKATAREVGFLGLGFYPRSGFMRDDLGPAGQWGERVPIRQPYLLPKRRARAKCWPTAAP